MRSTSKKISTVSSIVIGWLILGMAYASPVHAAQINRVVTNTNDSGAGSLRQAVLDVNANTTTPAAPHQITFNIPGSGVQTISLLSAINPTQPVVIDGLTQPGSSCGNLVPSLPATSNTPHTLMVKVTSRAAASGSTIILTGSAGGSVLRGLIINGASSGGSYGIVDYVPNTLIECNYIGTEEDGVTFVNRTNSGGMVFNQLSDGIEIRNNLVSGNGTYGIFGVNSLTSDTTTNVKIHNNLIGTNASGTSALPNADTAGTTGYGLRLTYGTTNDVYQNVISGHKAAGVTFNNQDQLKIRGNFIGTNLAGTGAIANKHGITDSRNNGTVLIGGSIAADRNVISGNTNNGYNGATAASADSLKLQGNYFGCNADCSAALPNGAHNIALIAYTNPQIGGSNAGEGNVVVAAGSGSFYGIYIQNGSGAQLKGNYVGITPSDVVMQNAYGVYLMATSGVTIGGTGANDRNVISGNNASTRAGILMTASSNIYVEGNYIGVGSDGAAKRSNYNGISISSDTTNVRVGGALAAQRNIISGNTANGIVLGATSSAANNLILGNYIGIDKNGDPIAGASATGVGIVATSVNGLRIGGAVAGEGNVISGNVLFGIQMGGSGAGTNVLIYGNTIGLKPDGITAAPNQCGIYMTTMSTPSGSIRIGGSSAGQGNTISGNTNEGIRLSAVSNTAAYPVLILGNTIGLSRDKTTAVGNGSGGFSGINVNASTYVMVGGIGIGEGNTISGNTQNGVLVSGSAANNDSIRGNSIWNNGMLGIDLNGAAANAPDPIDLTDADTGANGLQNYPRRTTLTKCDGSTETRTVLRSAANATYTIDFYANPSGRDSSGYGEGEQYISSTTVTTNSSGYAEITPPNATNLSMTATAPDGSTSEFSNERSVSVSDCDIAQKTTNDTTPPLDGSVATSGFSTGYEPSTKITVDTQTVTGTTTSPTWTLADNTLAPISTGTYDVTTTFTDQETTMTASKTVANALTIDTTAPTISVVRKTGQAQYTQTNSAWFSVTLSEAPASGAFTASDVDLGTTTGSITTFTQTDATHYEFEVTGMTSGDTVTATVGANAFADSGGNGNTASSGSPNNTVMYDTTAPQSFAVNVEVTGSYSLDSPRITWSTIDNQSGIGHYEISYDNGAFTTVTSPQTPSLIPATSHKIIVRAYDRAGNMREKTVQYPPVVMIDAPTTLSSGAITDTVIRVQGPTGMVITDVSFSGAGVSGFSCTPTPGPAATVTINCSGGSITATGTLTVTATSDGGVTTSNSQDYVIDTGDPSVTINQNAGQPDPTNTNSASFRLVFSEPMLAASLTVDDITISGTSGSVTTLTQIDSRTWDATVTGMTSGDTVTASLGTGKATDLAGNGNAASTSTDNAITYDSSQPTITINQNAGQPDPTNVNSASFTITTSEALTSFVASDLAVSGTGGTVTSFMQLSTTTYEAAITGMTSGDTAKLSLAAGQVTDTAGNGNTASTSTDNAVTYDSTTPAVTISPRTTNDATPALSGTVNDPAATIKVTVNGTMYTAANNADGTWTLANDSITPALADGAYDLDVTATDLAGNVGLDAAVGGLVIDTSAPTGTVNPVPTGISNSPEMSGTVNDPAAIITVMINGHTFAATNNGSSWVLPAGTISPALAPGGYTATVSFRDAAGNQSAETVMFTIQRGDADIPTVNIAEWVGGQPVISGTYDAANSQSLRVRVGTNWYMLNVSTQLTVSDNTWTLDLRNLTPPLAAGTYDISAEVTTRDGQVLGDISQNELTVLAITLPNIITHPLQLAYTGSPVWQSIIGALMLIVGGIYRLVMLKRSRSRASTL